jgi:hypothetical protein
LQQTEINRVLNHPLSQELLARDPTRLAYIARDGTIRAVRSRSRVMAPIVMCTSTNAPKRVALCHNPT